MASTSSPRPGDRVGCVDLVARRGSRPLAALLAALAASSAGAARGEEAAAAGIPPGAGAAKRWLVEFKRQATERGTPEETTKTQLKLEYLPDGPVTLLRLEVPFPDETSSFSGSPFDPDFGDMKLRAGFRAVDILVRPVTSFLEVTFPTANPESQGAGKYQLSEGIRTTWPLGTGPEGRRNSLSAQLQQVVSTGGDAARSDINQTKIEVEARTAWPRGHFAKATFKPLVDWVGDGQTGAVLELEGGWAANRDWTVALLGGLRVWGAGVPGTYGKRVELKAIYRF